MEKCGSNIASVKFDQPADGKIEFNFSGQPNGWVEQSSFPATISAFGLQMGAARYSPTSNDTGATGNTVGFSIVTTGGQEFCRQYHFI